MTECEFVQSHLSALLDDALSPEDASRVQVHLASCEGCAQRLQELRQLDALLSQELVLPEPTGLAETTVPQIDRDVIAAERSRSTRPLPRRWISLAAIAASVCAILYVNREGEAPPIQSGPAPLGVRLVSATGPIELRGPSGKKWQWIEEIGDFKVTIGSRLRTGSDALCEVTLVDDANVRMNRETEILFAEPSKIELVKGQVWCCSSKQETFEVQCALPVEKPGEIRSPAQCHVNVPCQIEVADLQCTVAVVDEQDSAETKTEVSKGPEVWTLSPGEALSFDQNQGVTRFRPEHDVSWQLPLLAASTHYEDELRGYMQRLLAPIGMTKAMHLNESQIRALGAPGAIPLLVYVKSESDPAKRSLRLTALRLAATTADESAVPILKELANDSDELIAAAARRALQGLQKG